MRCPLHERLLAPQYAGEKYLILLCADGCRVDLRLK